ncbi:MAG: hypothetical protein COU29_02005 [Candidatus Magasanikbacteria bacterium CG10_big_fil_rev_8_21_14_0_10_36_32]|uniref:DUF3267 domain-containing protein n=1 Tax=Candidatus Magasanikbacteria bacterium CG10_big_fil_rev_8_21_14_0_10_36_32 TaxID=1974646 RepID=A0A2M6W6Y3_9BACT|nr:MAG: hypothetical protein COU29_02005 [Candidatus Magasanikbacteria bacterium CG10_big_fil_rev_8_21_14_0_10_36_32]
MFFYYFYSIITAPGVVIHELSHTIFCLLSGVKIYKINLFKFGRIAGYVVHDEPKKVYQSFLISFGPLFINSFLALCLFSQIIPPYLNLLNIIYFWLGGAIALHAIPSTGDAQALFKATNHGFWKNPTVLIIYPFILLLYILNFFRRLHLDIIYFILLLWLGNIYLK